MSRLRKAFFLFILLTFLLFNKFGFAEQTMDSADALSVAQATAMDRCQKGNLREALAAEQDALRIAENRYGPTHPSLVPILTDLAALYRHLALYPEAESNLQWALAIREKNFGAEDPTAAETLSQLASLYFDWGHWEDAEFYQKKALNLIENQKSGVQDPMALGLALKQSGQIELELSKKDEALSFLKKSSEILEKSPAVEPEQLLEIWDLLARAYQSSSRVSDEQICLERALKTAQSRFKPNSLQVADSEERLADFYHSQNRDSQAKPLYDSALKIYQSGVGSYFGYSSFPYVQKLAKADEKDGRWKEAEDLLQNLLQASRKIYGANHPRTAVALLDLAQAEEGLGQKSTAQENLKKAQKIARAFYRDDNPLVVQIQKGLRP